MSKFIVSIQRMPEANEKPAGLNMNVQVDANNVLEAVSKAVDEVKATLEASGLTPK